jgi:hypothetical protein
LEQLRQLTSASLPPTFSAFQLPAEEFAKICKEFNGVSGRVSVRAECLIDTERKYIVLRTAMGGGVKTVMLEEGMKEIQVSVEEVVGEGEK